MSDHVVFWAQVSRPDKVRLIWSFMWRGVVTSLFSFLVAFILGFFIRMVGGILLTAMAALYLGVVVGIGFGVVYIYWLFSAKLGAFRLALVSAQSSTTSEASDI